MSPDITSSETECPNIASLLFYALKSGHNNVQISKHPHIKSFSYQNMPFDDGTSECPVTVEPLYLY